jgi:hypothetical protein
LALRSYPALSDLDINTNSDKVGHCLREAMVERYSTSKPLFNKTTTSLEPKPLACSSLRNGTSVSFYQPMTTSLHVAHDFDMTDSGPSIVSDADVRDTSSQEGDDDSTSCSVDSTVTPAMFVSNQYSSQSIATMFDALHELPFHDDEAVTSLPCFSKSLSATKEGISEVVDALYELPSQGEWEELILPRASLMMSGLASLVTA